MITGLKPYPAMKDSGVPWLGEVPEHWPVARLKWFTSINPGRAEARAHLEADKPVAFLPMERVGSDGRIDAHEVLRASDVWNGLTYFRHGDVIIAKITPCFENGKGACLDSLPTEIGFGSTEFHVVRAGRSILPQFLYRLTTVAEFRKLGADAMIGAAGQQRVPHTFVSNWPIALPPLPEQAAIVRYLDFVDRRIRRYIRAKQKLIKLLEEQKQAIIHRTVTRGLDANVRLKSSGVEWLGDVPEHWEITRVNCEFYCFNNRRIPLSGTERGAMTIRRYDYYGASGVIDKVENYLFDDELLLIAEDGANLVRRNLPLAIIARGKFWVNNHAHILKPKRGNLEFLASVMEGLNYLPWISGAAQPKLTKERLMGIAIAVPPPNEQDRIIDWASAEMAALQIAIDNAQREIALLREYRTRVVAEMVTGKLDVHEIAAQLPDEPDKPEPLAEFDEPLDSAADGEDALEAALQEAVA